MDWNFTKREVVWIIISVIIFGFITGISYKEDTLVINYSLSSLIVPILVVMTSIIVKKYIGNIHCIKIEHSVWKFQRYGWYLRSYFKKPFPIGIVFPFFLSLFSLGIIKPLAILQFDAENIPEKRILRRKGRIRKMEINEGDLSITAMAGFYSLLLLSLIGIIFKYPELAKYSIYYGAWNLVPFGGLDGTKVFFWNAYHWFLLVIFYILFIIGLILFL
ncbi:hypothetical protein J4429_06680 [Candidatus Pacearchaeota archaeon]|nr:hypothetical protein [Candidatus Pacearchaeota archaeon]